MTEYQAHDARIERVALVRDASRPFIVCEYVTGRKSVRIKGRYATMSGAKAAAFRFQSKVTK